MVSVNRAGQLEVDLVTTGGVNPRRATPRDDNQNVSGRRIRLGDRHDVGANVEFLIPDADLALLETVGHPPD
jgi:hypothetical protein